MNKNDKYLDLMLVSALDNMPLKPTLQGLEQAYSDVGVYYLIKHGYTTKQRAVMDDDTFEKTIRTLIPDSLTTIKDHAERKNADIAKCYFDFQQALEEKVEGLTFD